VARTPDRATFSLDDIQPRRDAIRFHADRNAIELASSKIEEMGELVDAHVVAIVGLTITSKTSAAIMRTRRRAPPIATPVVRMSRTRRRLLDMTIRPPAVGSDVVGSGDPAWPGVLCGET
jgi:hypothetical protein